VDLQPEHEPAPRPVSPVAVLMLTFAGGGLALLSIRLRHGATDLAACACLLAAWYLSGRLTRGGQAAHPLGRRYPRTLLLLFAALTGAAGVLRIIGRGL